MKSPALLIKRARRQIAELEKTLAKLEPLIDTTSLDAGPPLPGRRSSNGRWTEEDNERLHALIARGMSHEQIAVVMSRTPGAVAARISRLRRAQAQDETS